MKFCKYCGKQLEDNEVCTCQNTQPKNNSPYATQTKEQPSELGKKISAAFKNLPMSFKSFWKNPDNTASIAIREKDVVLSSIYSAIFFIATLLYNVFLFLSFKTSVDGFDSIPFVGSFISGVNVFNFGKILLTAIVMTTLIGGLYILISAVISLVMSKCNAKSAFLNAFITFSIKSIPFSILLILSGLLSFLSFYLMLAFLVIAITYIIISLCSDLFILTGSATKNTKIMTIVNLSVAIALIICVFISFKLLLWNFDFSSLTNSINSIF